MPTVLGLAAIVVLPSYREGLPKFLLEAASAGRPIITTDVPGCRETVLQGENGILVPPRDPVALSNAIRILVSNPVLRKEMGIRSREIAVAEFSEERVIRETLSVYSKLLGPKWPESKDINCRSCT
jgi:glycosyltransferase involved in cell wall biosynthesis